MVTGFKRSVLTVIAGVMFLSPVLALATPAIALAAQDNPQNQLERWLYYRGMRDCMQSPDFNTAVPGSDNRTISVADLEREGLKEGNNKAGFGYLGKDIDNDDSNDGTVNCSDGSIWVRGANLFGFGSVKNLVCAMNAAAEELGDGGRISPNPDIAPCVENATEFELDGGDDIWQRMLTKALENPISSAYGGDGDRPDFDFNDNGDAGKGYTYLALLYLLGKNSLEAFCGGPLANAKPNNQYDSSNQGVSVYIVNSDGTIKKSDVGDAGFSHTYVITKKDNESDNVNDVYYRNGGSANEADDRSCADMARFTREGARDYAIWAKENESIAKEIESGSDGAVSDGGDSGSSSNTSCAIDGIGWIICPVMNFLAEANEQAFGFLQNLLEIRPSLVQDKATVDVWSRFRDLANIAFVIAFLIIIYSQITSMGVSNYGIKKLLPKIAASAILVNLSLFICQVLVDVSNIAGASLYSFIENIAPVTSATADDSSWTNVMTGLLAAGVTVLLIAAIVLAPTVLLALGLILLILVARQAFILILVVIAPLAFVAYLLPNTEQWFKKWWKALSAMLLVYPIIAVVFGASTLASNILMRIADGTSGEEDSQLLAIVALGVMAIPLFAVPTLLKGAMAGAGTIGAKLANLQDRTNRIGRGQLGDRAKQMRGGLDNYRTEMATQKRGLGRFDAFRRGKLRRDSKYEALDARGKAAAAQFGVSDDRSRKYGMQKSDAEHKMKTANVELEASAVEARSLDEIVAHNVAQARLDSAGRVQQEAYSKEVLSNASVAKAAGGIDKYGQTRAVGLATQSLHKAYDDGVSAEKSTMSDNTHEELMSIMTNKNLSSERRAAAAGTIMSRDFAEGHLQALEAAGQIGRSGDDEFISDIQKQMAYDMKNKPFALGDQAAGQLKIGTYGKPQPKVVNADGTEFQPPQLGDLNAELRERIEKKLSPAGLAKMNPDELKRVHKMLKNNELSTEQKASMVSAITAARADEQYKGLIKPEAAKLHQDFLDFQ